MDIKQTTAPKSDQQNFDDYISGPKTVTISKVSAGSAEQPVDIHLVEFPGHAFRPSKSMRRVLVASWGPETEVYVGRKMTLYGDPNVKFGGIAVGGIKISHLSHIDKPLKIALTITRGKREPFTVQPLVDSAPDTTPPTRTSLHEAGADFGIGVGQPITEKQIGMMGRLLKKLRMDDREIAIAFVSNVIGRPIESRNELTAHEASKVIDVLLKEEEQMKLRDEAGGVE